MKKLTGRGARASLLGCAATVWFLLPAAAPAGDWTITPSLNESMTATDNARGSAGGREGDVFNTTEAALKVRGLGARARLNFDYSLSRDTYIDNTDLDALQQKWNGLGNIELWEDHLFFDARSSLSTQSLTRLGANAAGERILTSNQVQVLSYSAGPTFRRRYAGWADSEIAYRFNGSHFSKTDLDATNGAANPSSRKSHELTTALRSGPRFSTLEWQLNSVQSITKRGSRTSKRRTSDLSGEYHISRFISARAAVGHEKIDEPDFNNDVSGMTWSLGTRLTPGPRTELVIDYERRFQDFVWSAEGFYLLGPAARISFSYKEDVQTEQQQIDEALQGLTLDPLTGELVGPDGLPANPNSLQFDLVDQTSRTRTARLSFTGTVLRNTYAAAVIMQEREFDATGGSQSGTEQVASFNVSYSRRLNPQTTFRASARYSETVETTTPGTGDSTMSARLSLSKRFPSDLFGDVVYDFRRQDRESGGATLENAATVRLRKEF